MSTATLTRAGDFDGFDELAEFAALVESYNRDDLQPEGRVHEKRLSRGEADRRAIDESRREWS